MEDFDKIQIINNINIEQFLDKPKNDSIIEKANLNDNNEHKKNHLSDFNEELGYNKKLNINIKDKPLEKIKINRFKKDENRIPCSYGREKPKENSLSKSSRSSSVKLKLKESLNINYDKLKKDLMPLNDLDGCLKLKKIKSKFDELNTKKKKKKEVIKIELIQKYQIHKNFGDNKNYFIILIIIGIFFSIINLILSILLVLYGNKEILSLFIVLNLFVIFFYAIGIYFLEKNYSYTFQIIAKNEAPQKIENSIHRNNIYLLIYFLFFELSFYLTLVSGFTIYKNNIKIDIRSKGYDKKKWKYFFQNKTFRQVLNDFEKINKIFISFCWLSIIIIIILILFFIYELHSYQFWKRIIQTICLHFGQISFLLINISAYCFQFRNITNLDEYQMAWVIIGLIIMGIIGVIMSFYGFWIFYSENSKFIKIFNYLCILFFIFTAVFTAGAKALGLKFNDYKTASCNHIFKFISEDYLLQNHDCSSKYLSNHDTLNFVCPKERIMINWELTEESHKDKVEYGCINQSCCLKVYCKLKTGFNYQEIIAFNQLILYIILFISGKYMQHKVEIIEEEEIIEKFNLLITFSLTLLVYIICLVLIIFRPPTSKQSILNDIKGNKINKELTIINKDWISLNNLNILPKKSYEYLIDIFDTNNYILNISLINDIDDESFNFEYYEYYLYSPNFKIEINKEYEDNAPFYDYNEYIFSNNTIKINFKSRDDIINSIYKYFKFYPNNPFNGKNIIFISLYCIYSINLDDDKIKNEIDYINKNFSYKDSNISQIKITKELILLNFNVTENKSIINLLKNKEITLVNNKINKNIISIYLKGNIYNDTGQSLIEIYNYLNNEVIYSEKTDENGEFSIGPLFIFEYSFLFELELNFCKIKESIENSFEYDTNYNNYSLTLKIPKHSFNPDYHFPLMRNIILPKVINKNFEIKGKVFDSNNNKPLKEVFIKLYKGNKVIKIKDAVDRGHNLFDKEDCLIQETSEEDGSFIINIQNNGQYTLLYEKDGYFIETQSIIINNSNIKVNNIGLIKLFNAGKIVIKLEWENNPPDLDLICRFNVTNYIYKKKTNFCYTFFGNRKCINTHYEFDNKRGGKNGAEIVEINSVEDYNYFFYVRKYFDISNNTAINEFKINDVEYDLDYNKDIDNDIFKFYHDSDEFLKNSSAKLSLYANGLSIPAIIIYIPNENIEEYEYNYWAGFCFNGKEGLNNLKIINKFYENEPPKNICSSYF